MQVQQQHRVRDTAIRVGAGAVVGGALFSLGGKLPAALIGVGIGGAAGLAGSVVGGRTEVGIGIGAVTGIGAGVALSRFIKQIPAIKSTTAAVTVAGVAGLLAGCGAAMAIGLMFPPDAGEGARIMAPAAPDSSRRATT
ncbi:MAG: hypothetical protein JWN72_2715 [Thermoleophilia bacterium]|nr:hypothetical protein [Thermoleophilia bacterium]